MNCEASPPLPAPPDLSPHTKLLANVLLQIDNVRLGRLGDRRRYFRSRLRYQTLKASDRQLLANDQVSQALLFQRIIDSRQELGVPEGYLSVSKLLLN